MVNFVVTNLNDSGAGSLRNILAVANATAGADNITFASGLTGGTLVLTSGELSITDDVTINGDINGDKKADITISGNNASRIIHQTGSNTDLTLNSLTLTNGNAVGLGNSGGAIKTVTGTISINDTTIKNSKSGGDGGGLYVIGTKVNMTNSLVTGNFAAYNGGGMALTAIGGLYDPSVLIQTTIDGNSSNLDGGGVALNGTSTNYVAMRFCTITNNRAEADGGTSFIGGGVSTAGVQSYINTSVVAGNSFSNGAYVNDVSGTVKGAVDSVFGSTPASIAFSLNNLFNVSNTGLGALQNNGGTVLTRSVLPDSVLINRATNAVFFTPSSDANGNGRKVAGFADAGATEFQLVVTTAQDVVANDGQLSLREAIALANANANADKITFAANLAGQTIILTAGELALTQDVTINGDIDGNRTADVSISGNNTSRIFRQTGDGTDVNLQSLTLTNGRAVGAGSLGYGGAIRVNGIGTLNILDTTIINNTANQGGGLYQGSATVTILNSLVTSNSALGEAASGGGLYVWSGTLNLINSTVDSNIANGLGGGLQNVNGAVAIRDSTFFANKADVNGNSFNFGGGVVNGTTLTTINSVFFANTSGAVSLNDVKGSINTSGASIFGSSATILSSAGGDVQNAANISLGELLDNGGTVLTRSPLDGSILIGAGFNIIVPTDSGDVDRDGDTTEVLPLDGRGGLRIVGGTVDVGAVEQIVNETIRGTAGNNTIIGGLGTDNLSGLAGDDTINGGAGADTMNGGSNTAVGDTLSYEGSSLGVSINLLTGLAQTGDAQGDTFSGFENVTGSSLGDQLVGDNGNNVLKGGAGNDLFAGGLGADTMIGGADLDVVDYSAYTTGVSVNLTTGTATGGDVITEIENITGSAFGDVLDGNNGANTMRGGAGNDFMVAGNGADLLIGGADNDEVSYATATGGVLVNLSTGTGANGGVLQEIENIRGSNFGDVLQGDNGANTIRGLDGNDFIIAGNGADLLIGGNDNDTVSYETATAGVFANLTTGIGANGGVLQEIENLTGSNFGDVLIGSTLGNTLKGGGGNDYLVGNAGSDALYGGADNDTFRFETTTFGNDVIVDFQDNGDKLSFAAAVATNFSQFTILNNNTSNVTVQIAGQSIVVQGVANISLTASDFLFV